MSDAVKQALDAQGWPINPETNRFVCTPDYPMPKDAGGRWEHGNATEIDCTCDCCAKYKCLNCGHIWKEELPQ